MRTLLTALGLLVSTGLAAIDDSALVARYQRIQFQRGDVVLGHHLAQLSLGNAYTFVNPDDADFILEKLWGNPHQEKILGMIFPAGHQPLDTGSWAAVVQYDEDGHVKDNDAASIDYGQLLQQMQKEIQVGNTARSKNGYPPMELLGWAEKPYYDAQAKKLYWAKALRFGQNVDTTLNYNIRILGRKGVLLLNVVASMRQLNQVRQDMGDLLGRVDFLPGNRYTDYKKGIDPLAKYGLAALVAGGVLAKLGFFKLALAALLAAKKFLILAVLAVIAFFKKWFRRRSPDVRRPDDTAKKLE